MQKLLNSYLRRPTLKNAQKLVAYDHKHPFASCAMTQFDIELLNDARAHAKGEVSYPSERRVG